MIMDAIESCSMIREAPGLDYHVKKSSSPIKSKLKGKLLDPSPPKSDPPKLDDPEFMKVCVQLLILSNG
jgi:hypothetical protein